ncbi:uncharacterized protein [Panulirus ornatus]|uniref:uncharacterized protein isoform X1 n=1 Tax=Panulirus ornatus TaxID=150431 RepID=UPI003A88DEBD
MIDPQTWSSCSTVIQRAGRAKEDLVILQASAGTEMASNTVSNQRPDLHTHVMATTVGRETQHRLPVITCGSEQCSARLTLTPPLPQISRAVPSTSARTHLAPGASCVERGSELCQQRSSRRGFEGSGESRNVRGHHGTAATVIVRSCVTHRGRRDRKV